MLPSWSIRRRALRRRRELRRHRLRGAARRARAIAGVEWIVLGLLAFIAVGGLFAPAILDVEWAPEEATIRRFLPVVWQVNAAAVGLSFAIVVFSFERYSTADRGGALREFRAYAQVVPIVLFGLLTLLVDGLALLGVGRDAPYGWAGYWAVILSLAAIVSLPLLMIVIFRGLEPGALQSARLERLADLIKEMVDREVLSKVMYRELEETTSRAGWKFVPLFGSSDRAGWTRVSADRTGVVTDIRTRLLTKLSAGQKDDSKPELYVFIGQRVVPQTIVLGLPSTATDQHKHGARRIVRVGRRTANTEELKVAVERLHEQARRAITNRNSTWLEEVLDSYKELLTALPRTWKEEFGVAALAPNVAASVDWLSPSAIDVVGRKIYLEIQAAVNSGDPELVQIVLSGTYSILLESTSLRAEAVSKSMLSLLPHAYRLSIRSANPDISEASSDLVCTYLLELFSLISHQLRDSTVGAEDRASLMRHGELVTDCLGDVLRAAIDAGRVSDVRDVHAAWRSNLDTWIDPSDDSPLADLARREANLRVGLTFWALRAAPTGRRAESAQIINYFAGSFESINGVFDATGRAINARYESEEWLDWSTLPRFGGAFSVGTDLQYLNGGLMSALVLAAQGQPASIVASDWLASRVDAALQFIDSVTWDDWTELFPSEDVLTNARETLRDSLQSAAAEYRAVETQKELDTPLSKTLIDSLKQQATARWLEHSLVRRLFERVDRTQRTSAVVPADIPSVGANIRRLFLVEGATEESIEFLAREIGQNVARRELEGLTGQSLAARIADSAGPTLGERIEEVVATIAAESSSVLCILMPVNWRVELSLGLRAQGSSESVFFGDAGPGNWFRGEVQGIPVVQHRTVPSDRVIVLGGDWAHYVEYGDASAAPLTFDLEDVGLNLRLTIRRPATLVVEKAADAVAVRFDDLDLSAIVP